MSLLEIQIDNVHRLVSKENSKAVTNSECRENSWIKWLSNLLFAPRSEALTIPASNFSLFLIFVGSVIYVLDVTSDVLLAINYYYSDDNDRIFKSGLILIFVSANFIFFHLHVGWELLKIELEDETMEDPLPKWRTALLHLSVCLGPVANDFSAFKNGLQTQKCVKNNEMEELKKFKSKMNKEALSAANKRFWESWIESFPQATLQVHIILKEFNKKAPNFAQVATLMISFASLAWSRASLKRRLVAGSGSNQNISYFGSLTFCFGNVLVIISRSLAITLLPVSYLTMGCIFLSTLDFSWLGIRTWNNDDQDTFQAFDKTFEDFLDSPELNKTLMHCLLFRDSSRKGKNWNTFIWIYFFNLFLITIFCLWTFFGNANSALMLWKVLIIYALFYAGVNILAVYKAQYEFSYLN